GRECKRSAFAENPITNSGEDGRDIGVVAKDVCGSRRWRFQKRKRRAGSVRPPALADVVRLVPEANTVHRRSRGSEESDDLATLAQAERGMKVRTRSVLTCFSVCPEAQVDA